MSDWVIIPAFNEGQRLSAVLQGLATHPWQVVVVDDGSTDETARVAAGAGVIVLRHLINRGQGAALRTGLEYALMHGATQIVTFDADGQHSADDIPRLLQTLQRDEAELVLGSRFLGTAPGIPWHRRCLLRMAVLLTRLTTGLRLTDTHNGLRAMTGPAAAKLRFSEDGMAHASQILSLAARLKLRVCEVPCSVRYTEQTLSKGQRSSAAFRILGRLAIARLLR
jgi:polyprenyl-phospho-N-acetylgalactosaminyl synthase